MIITDEKLLRVKCEDVSNLDEAYEIIEKLEKELKLSGEQGKPGIGLAAPQIGIAKKAAIVRIGDEFKVNLINCRIKQGFDKQLFNGEGCLSFPGRVEQTMRYQEIYVVDNLVWPHRFIAKGLFAVAIQHEQDHLFQRLLPDFALKKINNFNNLPKRNELCFCGSGKKFKKCHGKES